MTLTVHLFARFKELAGATAVALDLPPGAAVRDLRTAVAARFPAAARLLERSAIARNHDFVDDDLVLAAGDELAVIPPVSGG